MVLFRSGGNPSATSNHHRTANKWSQYFSKLKHSGYFKDYLPGSKPYQQLLETATRNFSLTSSQQENSYEPTEDCVDLSIKAADHINRFLELISDEDIEKLKSESTNLPANDGKTMFQFQSEKFCVLNYQLN